MLSVTDSEQEIKREEHDWEEHDAVVATRTRCNTGYEALRS